MGLPIRDVLLELIRLSMLVTGDFNILVPSALLETGLDCAKGVEIEDLPALSEVKGFMIIWFLIRVVLFEFLLLSKLTVPLILLRTEFRFAIEELNPLCVLIFEGARTLRVLPLRGMGLLRKVVLLVCRPDTTL